MESVLTFSDQWMSWIDGIFLGEPIAWVAGFLCAIPVWLPVYWLGKWRGEKSSARRWRKKVRRAQRKTGRGPVQ